MMSSIGAIAGPPGEGKSYFGLRLAEIFDPDFDVTLQVVFTRQHLIYYLGESKILAALFEQLMIWISNFLISPLSLVLNGLIGLYLILKLKKRQIFNGKLGIFRATYLSFFTLVFVNTSFDVIWWCADLIRFGASFPVFLSFVVRDEIVASASLLLLRIIKKGLMLDFFKWKDIWKGFVLIGVFFALWFGLSPSYAYMDWKFALLYGYDPRVVLISLLVSSIGKVIILYASTTIWNKETFDYHPSVNL